jgi:hypothetical protein
MSVLDENPGQHHIVQLAPGSLAGLVLRWDADLERPVSETLENKWRISARSLNGNMPKLDKATSESGQGKKIIIITSYQTNNMIRQTPPS